MNVCVYLFADKVSVLVCAGINVPRSRFLPVKLTSDLMLVMSNLYAFNTGCLQMNPKRAFQTVPLVKLGRSFVTVCLVFTICLT